MKASAAGVLRGAWRPLAWYYAVALAVPVLNGVAFDRGFLEHSAFVVAVPIVLVAAVACVSPFLARLG